MFGNKDGKPVDIVLTENTGIEGTHHAAGTVLKQVEADLAMELCGQGKARLAQEADLVRKPRQSQQGQQGQQGGQGS